MCWISWTEVELECSQRKLILGIWGKEETCQQLI